MEGLGPPGQQLAHGTHSILIGNAQQDRDTSALSAGPLLTDLQCGLSPQPQGQDVGETFQGQPGGPRLPSSLLLTPQGELTSRLAPCPHKSILSNSPSLLGPPW